MKIRKLSAGMMLATFGFAIVGTALPAQATTETIRDENVSAVQYGEAEFSLEGSSTATAKVTSKSGMKIMLNVSVKPMKPRTIKRCWTVKPGTVIKNEGYWNGTLSVANWTVTAGDNTFCYKKGHGKQVFKKSCDNRVWGVPGGPKRPPQRLPRVKGKVTFADYHVYSVKQTVKESLAGSATAQVAIYDDEGRTLCAASGTIRGKGFAFSATTVRVRSRSVIQAKASGGRQILINAQSNETLHIDARNGVNVELEGEVNAYCAVYTNPTPPPATPKAVVSVDQLNDIDETDPKCLEEYDNPTAARVACESWTVFQAHVTVPDGVSGTLRVDSLYGVTAFSKGTPADFSDDVKSIQLGSGQSDPEIRYGAPTEVPAGGYDTITVTFTPAGGGDSVQATTRIRINETVTPPM